MMPPKRRGELAEIHFMAAAADRGLRFAEPHGDSRSYDSLIEQGTTTWRVQVKGCNERANKGRYRCNACHTGSGRPYRKNEIDFLACYIFRVKAWYIIPQSAIRRRTAVHLFAPRLSHKGNFSQYYEAWHLLKQKRPCSFCMQACVEPDAAESPQNQRIPALPIPDLPIPAAQANPAALAGLKFRRLKLRGVKLASLELPGLELRAYVP